MMNLAQWHEHATGQRIIRLDPERHQAEYNDLLLSTVHVCAGQGAAPGVGAAGLMSREGGKR